MRFFLFSCTTLAICNAVFMTVTVETLPVKLLSYSEAGMGQDSVPHIIVISTGGTISGGLDPETV